MANRGMNIYSVEVISTYHLYKNLSDINKELFYEQNKYHSSSI